MNPTCGNRNRYRTNLICVLRHGHEGTHSDGRYEWASYEGLAGYEWESAKNPESELRVRVTFDDLTIAQLETIVNIVLDMPEKDAILNNAGIRFKRSY